MKKFFARKSANVLDEGRKGGTGLHEEGDEAEKRILCPLGKRGGDRPSGARCRRDGGNSKGEKETSNQRRKQQLRRGSCFYGPICVSFGMKGPAAGKQEGRVFGEGTLPIMSGGGGALRSLKRSHQYIVPTEVMKRIGQAWGGGLGGGFFGGLVFGQNPKSRESRKAARAGKESLGFRPLEAGTFQ